jgi:dihydrofolate reductase
MIRAIAAIDEDRGIAAGSHRSYAIPWDIPDDRRYFKQQTANATVIMGRKTYELFDAPLPERQNIVVSRTLRHVREGFILVHDLDSYLEGRVTQDIWIIGGAQTYNAALRWCQELYLTHVEGAYGCRSFFPQYDEQFNLKSKSQVHQQNSYQFQYTVYTKKPVNHGSSPATSVS